MLYWNVLEHQNSHHMLPSENRWRNP